MSTQSKPVDLTSENFESTLQSSDGPVLVDFHAQWCGPCKMLSPVIDQIASERGDSTVVAKVDIDAARDIAQKYGITSVPTLIVFRDGEPVKASRGMQSKAAIEAMIDEASSVGAS
ncbi:MAG: thioredoxin [Verrucomicrobiota bacterium]